jgi:anti-sigma regulatory factor (Ser/Thr protein kinase)
MISGRSILTVTNEIAYLPVVQSFARELSKEIGFGKDDQEMILLALEESVINVIEHAFEAGEQATFQIIFEPSITGIKIIIKDKGLPYDPDLLPEYRAPDDFEHIPPHGLGSFIMKKCVDEVAFCNLGREGKELHLIKHLPRKNIIEYYETSPSEPVPKPPEEKTSSVPPPVIEVRLMKPSEAVEVSRLFYRTYEYSYASDVMYYPDRLAEHNREGLINSVVAVTGKGEIVGHLAMVRDALSDTIAETGKGAVKASFRGHDIFTRMEEFLINRAKTMGLKGTYGRAVTVHTFSQKMTEKTGHKDCAVLLGFMPGDVVFKGIAEKLSQRGALVYSFLPLVQFPVASVYLPSHHETIIHKIYSNLGLSRNFMTSPSDVPVDDLSVIKSKVIPEINTAEIVIHHYGKDCVTALRRDLRDLCAKKIDQITLFLNLGDPVTGRMCGEIEKLGFFISGIIPCLHFEDTLMLQYLNNIIIDYSQIKVHSDMAKEILAYIKESIAAENSGT